MSDTPDINIFVALLDDLHEHHSLASAWFEKASKNWMGSVPPHNLRRAQDHLQTPTSEIDLNL